MYKRQLLCHANKLLLLLLHILLFDVGLGWVRFANVSRGLDWVIENGPMAMSVLASPGYAPGTIAVNVTWIERGFNSGQTHSSIFPSIFNRLRAIARYWSEIVTFFLPPCI